MSGGEGKQSRSLQRWSAGELSGVDDLLAEETPVAFVYNGISHAVMMATPLDLEDFALGFSLSETIIDRESDLYEFDVLKDARGVQLQMTIASAAFARLKERRRTMMGVSGCGVCGSESLDQLQATPAKVDCHHAIEARAVQASLAAFSSQQVLRADTGSIHGAAWCDPAGNILSLREDIGRHNAVDKLIGALAKAGEHQAESAGFMLLSSRVSYEIVMKAAEAGIGIIVAASAATSLAAELAELAGITLIGFAREQRFLIYTHAQRLVS